MWRVLSFDVSPDFQHFGVVLLEKENNQREGMD
jgi:hypothetical protein